MPQPSERRYGGIPASGGLASGPAYRLASPTKLARRAGTPDEESHALTAALETSKAEIADLMARTGGDAAEILEFQVALLEDEEFVEPVYRRIAADMAADAAWSAALDAEIAEYASGEDAYLAARASDLADLRGRVLQRLCGGNGVDVAPPEGAIVIADDLTPSAFLSLDWPRLGGAALLGGSPTSHVSILARARGTPIVVGCDGLSAIAEGEELLLDGEAGTVIASPSADTRQRFRLQGQESDAVRAQADSIASQPARTADGVPIRVLINVDDPSILDGLTPDICDGVGLMRSEFLFQNGPPDETEQLAAYRRILAWADGRPVTIRTLDAGGDKPMPGITPAGESNPFLGVRGLRLSLAHPDLFRVQLRALVRAAATGPLKIMVPMVTVTDELIAARRHLDAVIADLAREGVPHARPDLGIMVETPAAALTADSFEADFYSIGSNDLVQYVMAAARDNPRVADLARADHPAVLDLIGRTVVAGQTRGVEVSVCGDMASRPDMVATLIRSGIRTLSVAPAQVGPIKLALSKIGSRP